MIFEASEQVHFGAGTDRNSSGTERNERNGSYTLLRVPPAGLREPCPCARCEQRACFAPRVNLQVLDRLAGWLPSRVASPRDTRGRFRFSGECEETS